MAIYGHGNICDIGFHHDIEFHTENMRHYQDKMKRSIFHKNYWERKADKEMNKIIELEKEWRKKRGIKKCEC